MQGQTPTETEKQSNREPLPCRHRYCRNIHTPGKKTAGSLIQPEEQMGIWKHEQDHKTAGSSTSVGIVEIS